MGFLVGQQRFGAHLALVGLAAQDQYLAGFVALPLQRRHELRQTFAHAPAVGLAFLELQLLEVQDASAIVLTRGGEGLLHVAVDVGYLVHERIAFVQPGETLARFGEETVVEVNNLAHGAPVVAQLVAALVEGLLVGQKGRNLGVEQAPVSASPTVDALLDVAHDEVAAVDAERIGEQGPEVFPLDARRVLELVNHVGVDARAGLLVDERRLAVAHQLVEQLGGVGKELDALLGAVVVGGLAKAAEQAELIEVLADDLGRDILPHSFGRKVLDKPLQDGLQPGLVALGQGFLPGTALGEPGRGVFAPLEHGGGHFLALAGLVFGQIGQDAGTLAREVVGTKVEAAFQFGHQGGGFLAELAEFGAPPTLDAVEHRHILAHLPLVVGPRLELLGVLPVLFGGELQGEPVEVGVRIPVGAVHKAAVGKLTQPRKGLGVGRGVEREQELRDGMVEDGIGVELDVVVALQVHLVGKAADDLLEEAVDGRDVQVAVAEQHVAEDAARLVANRLVGEATPLWVGCRQLVVVLRAARVDRELVNLGNDALFHLGRGLVGEGYGKNLAEAQVALLLLVEEGRELPTEEQTDVESGQQMSLSRTCRGFVNV